MSFLIIILYSISAVALGLLGFFLFKLISPFAGWRHMYPASSMQEVMDIPRKGKYAVCVSRDRFWLLSGQGRFSDIFTVHKADFAINKVGSYEQIPYYKRWGVRVNGFLRSSISIGYFEVSTGGRYSINLLTDNLLENDGIIIRRYLSIGSFVSFLLGAIFSFMAFLGTVITASLMLGGVI